MILNQAMTFPGVGKQGKHLADNNKQSHFSVTDYLWRHFAFHNNVKQTKIKWVEGSNWEY